MRVNLSKFGADLGRPIGHIQPSVVPIDVDSLLMEAIDKVAAREREFQDRRGRWVSLRIRPYKTLENKIDGAILTLIDIDTIKRAQRLAENIVATVREPLLVLDAGLRIQAASRSFYQLFQLTPEVTERRIFYELGKGQWNNPDLRRRLEQVLETDESFNDYSITHDFEGLELLKTRLSCERAE